MALAADSLEQPLSRFARGQLLVQISLLVFAFYAVVLASLLIVMLVIFLASVLALVPMRSASLPFVVNRWIYLLHVIASSFLTRQHREFDLRLEESDAPGLFAVLQRLCQQLQVPPPREVRCLMAVNAWVHLQGWGHRWGRVVLGVGYDLLAGLSPAQVEAVLAHELAHARLINRGLKRWVNGAFQQMLFLLDQLARFCDEGRRTGEANRLALAIFRMLDLIARLVARWVALFSRQDEFDADQRAARICGKAAAQSALQHTYAIAHTAKRLPWQRRVAKLHAPHGFSHWLISALQADEPRGGPTAMPDPYSTHPSLEARLQALDSAPSAMPVEPDQGTALTMLVDPDRTARRLIEEIERMAFQEECRDHTVLERWRRQLNSLRRIQNHEAMGMVFGGLALLLSLTMLARFIPASPLWWSTVCWIAAIGILAFRQGLHREERSIPVPEFGVMRAWRPPHPVALEEQLREGKKRIEHAIERINSKRERTRQLVREAYEALDQCEYAQAQAVVLVAAKRRIESPEILIITAITSAAFGDQPGLERAVRRLLQRANIHQPSVAWGLAWAWVLQGDNRAAEAMLRHLTRTRPEEATFWLLLASVEQRRGKSRSALADLRHGWALEPDHLPARRWLVETLLETGRWQEAGTHLDELRSQILSDPEWSPSLIRYELQRGALASAESLAERFVSMEPTPRSALVVAQALQEAHLPDRARSWYGRAQKQVFYPEACLGLGMLAWEKGDPDEARRQWLRALNLDRVRAADATHPLNLFAMLMERLNNLETATDRCRGWTVRIEPRHRIRSLAGETFLVYAISREAALQAFASIYAAMAPREGGRLRDLECEPAPLYLQPFGQVRPGIVRHLGNGPA